MIVLDNSPMAEFVSPFPAAGATAVSVSVTVRSHVVQDSLKVDLNA
jgi:hypothetical protein